MIFTTGLVFETIVNEIPIKISFSSPNLMRFPPLTEAQIDEILKEFKESLSTLFVNEVKPSWWKKFIKGN